MNTLTQHSVTNWELIIAIVTLAFTIICSIAIAAWTLAGKITASFHQVDKRIHGVEIIVTPYGDRIDDMENKLAAYRDRLGKVEGKQEARDADILRLERNLEHLQKPVK